MFTFAHDPSAVKYTQALPVVNLGTFNVKVLTSDVETISMISIAPTIPYNYQIEIDAELANQ